MAAIAALRLITALGVRGPFMGGVYLFNAPRVGNDVWRNGYNNLLGPRTLHYRIARCVRVPSYLFGGFNGLCRSRVP